jgi:hypothetical protein
VVPGLTSATRGLGTSHKCGYWSINFYGVYGVSCGVEAEETKIGRTQDALGERVG